MLEHEKNTGGHSHKWRGFLSSPKWPCNIKQSTGKTFLGWNSIFIRESLDDRHNEGRVNPGQCFLQPNILLKPVVLSH